MRKSLSWILGAAVLAGLVGCDPSAKSTVSALNTPKPTKTAFLVEASRPERRDVSEYLAETGHITAENQVEVLAKGTGHCLSIFVEEGDLVAKDAILAELDKAEMEAHYRQSQVNMTQQKISFERADAGMKQGIISPAERDNAKSAYEQSVASLQLQEVQLGHLTIRAPISGVITKRALQEGMLVSTGTPVFSIVDPNSFILPIFVTERSLPRLRIGQEARVTIDSSGSRNFTARVRRINPGIDPQTGTIKVILDFDPADHPYLRESAFARYSLVLDTHEQALVVPKDAILEENARRFVMIVKDAPPPADGAAVEEEETFQVAARVAVETGLEDSDYTEILSGIDDDSLIITLGQQSVNEGDRVKVGNVGDLLDSAASISAEDALAEAEKERAAEEAAKTADDASKP